VKERKMKIITRFQGMNISSKDPKQLALFYRDVPGLKILNEGSNYEFFSVRIP